MTIQLAFDQFIAQFIIALIPVIPVAIAAAIATIKVRANSRVLATKPSTDEVHSAINNKIVELVASGAFNGQSVDAAKAATSPNSSATTGTTGQPDSNPTSPASQ